jgi:LuxR family maltose regulon positive regulatory protein
MSTPVLATKLVAPVLRPRLVPRSRLTERLDGALRDRHRLTLVSAPAGFGKTTALGSWLTHLREDGRSYAAAWVSLDEGDNDLGRLLDHLLAALGKAGLDVGPLSPGTLRGPPAEALTLLVNAIAYAVGSAPRERWVVVLDDLHAVTAPEVHEAVTFLLGTLPAQVQLVLSTRSDPPLPLARLRTRGQLTEVRAADLRFTDEEARRFLHDTMALDLDGEDVAVLADRTEGWVAGLQLAALSLRDMDPSTATGFVAAFAGSHRFVLDYLADEVLARQPAELRDFLLATSVLERLTGPLCDALTGRTDSARVLGGLERDNLFLVPLDADRRWYRYHHLFADVLQARLLAEAPGRVPDLHRRASAWYEAGLGFDDAVRHALAADDPDRVARLVEEAVPEARRTRQDGLLATWARVIPEPHLRRSPVLSNLAAWADLMAGDLDAVEAHLDDAASALTAGAADPALAAAWADTTDLRSAPAMVEVYRASVAQARGDVAGTVAHAVSAMELAAPDDHTARGAAGGFLGLAAWAAGDVGTALSTFTEAVRSLHAAGNLVDELDSTVVRADMWLALGRPSRARRLYDEALASVVDAGEPYPRAAADLHVGLAELDLERGDLRGAEDHLESARLLAERTSITENRHRRFVVDARLHALRGDLDGALRLLDRAEQLYRPGFYPDLRPIPAVRARLALPAGDLDLAAGWARDSGVSVDEPLTYLREYEHLTLARLLLAEGQTADAQVLLGRLEAAAATAGRDGSTLETRVLRALAHHLAGDTSSALASLRQAWVAAPEADASVSLHLDEGAPMVDLLRQAAVGTDEVLRHHARRLLAAGGAPVISETSGPLLPDPLSPRELEVLRLLDSELTGPEIARQLFVSLNTLRTHTRRIFTKLDVGNRSAAVRRARQHGLL